MGLFFFLWWIKNNVYWLQTYLFCKCLKSVCPWNTSLCQIYLCACLKHFRAFQQRRRPWLTSWYPYTNRLNLLRFKILFCSRFRLLVLARYFCEYGSLWECTNHLVSNAVDKEKMDYATTACVRQTLKLDVFHVKLLEIFPMFTREKLY